MDSLLRKPLQEDGQLALETAAAGKSSARKFHRGIALEFEIVFGRVARAGIEVVENQFFEIGQKLAEIRVKISENKYIYIFFFLK